MKCLFILLPLAVLLSINDAKAQSEIKRRDLLLTEIKNKTVSSVKAVAIEFQAGQKAPYHRHPYPVVGYIAEGTCLLQVEGQAAQVLNAGDAFYEPAGTPITHFDNYSSSHPLKFIAYYLIDGDEELVELLPQIKQ